MNRSLFSYTLAAVLLIQTTVTAYEGDKQPATTIPNTSLQLIANAGQVTDQHGKLRSDIDAKAEHNGVTMFVGNGQLHYQWVKANPKVENSKPQKGNPNIQIPDPSNKIPDAHNCTATSPLERTGKVSIYRMDVTLVGANKNVEPIFEQPTGYFENYYLAHTGENGVQAKGYNRVVYKNVYPNIDWVIYTKSKVKGQNLKPENINDDATGEVLKYDFIIHPGGNVANIRMRYEGATKLRMENGALVAVTPYGSITEDAPYSYMQHDGAVVASKYILEDNELRLEVGSYEGTLVIDPVLKWGTYFGSYTSNEFINYGIATDTAGHTYMSGKVRLSGLATNGAYQDTLSGNFSALLVKFDTSGKRLWSTYFGRSAESAGVTCDSLNGVYIGGVTSDTANIATAASYQPKYPGIAQFNGDNEKAFVAKFNSTGQREWCSYYADSAHSWVQRITSDSGGNVYIVVHAWAAGTHVHKYSTTGAFLQTASFHSSAVAKFNTNGQRIWGSPVHSRTASDQVSNIAPDNAGNLFLTGTVDGHANDTIFVTAGTHQSVSAGQNEAFLLKLGNTGQKVWGTFYGGTSDDGGFALTTYKKSVFVLGGTSSSTGIATSGVSQPAMVGTNDAFIAKFDGNKGKLEWGTYYDGGGASMWSLGISAAGEIFAVGTTSSPTGVSTANALQPAHGGGMDLVITRLTNDGTKRKWTTYYGGGGNENLYSSYGPSSFITCYKNNIFISGSTNSINNIATANTHQPTLANGMSSTFLAKIYLPDTLVYLSPTFTDTLICTGDTLRIPYKVTTNFNSNNTFRVLLSNSSGSFTNPSVLGSVSSSTAGVISFFLPGSISNGTGYRIKIVATSPIDTTGDNGYDIRIGKYPAAFNSTVNKLLACTADTLKLSSSTTTNGVTYAWKGPNNFSANTPDATIPNPSLAGTGIYSIAINNDGCIASDSFAVTVAQSPENVTAANNGPVCTGDNLQLISSSTTSGVTYQWSPGNYITQNVNIPNVAKNQGGIYTVSAKLAHCITTANTNAIVEQVPIINIVPTTGTTLCIGELAQFAGFLNDAGTNPQMQWQVNGVDRIGETTNTFKPSTLNNGDKVRLKVIPNSSCPGTRYSNEITMNVLPPKAPTVSIVADINPPWNDNTIVTFTATVTNASSVAGLPPAYQWKKNGVNIGGAIGNYWAANTNSLSANDKVCVRVKSAYECPVPDTVLSNCINSEFTGVNDVAMGAINVYPNPVTNALHIDGVPTGYSVALYDVVGRKCNIVYMDGSIDMSALPAGNYMLQVTGANGGRAYFKVTKN